MSDYDVLRHFADSWGLLFMVTIFVFAVWRALRPSARQDMEDAQHHPA